MSPRWRDRLTRAVGLRLAAWYAAVFVLSAAGVGWLAYDMIAASLVSRDHDALRVKLAEYAARYDSGGLDALSQAVSAEQASGGPDSVLVRLVGQNADVLLVSAPPAWRAFNLNQLGSSAVSGADGWQDVPSPTDETTLEVVSRRMPDGTLMQVGRTTIGRERFLSQIRDLFGVLTIAILTAGLAGGIALTRQALQPLRRLRDAASDIARTGRFEARLTAGPGGDLVDELSRLFNAMLDRIQALVGGMRAALDNVAHDLRTPVARLRANAESALAARGTGDEAKEALADCVEEADRVMALLSTLLDISEAETGTMRLSLESISVAALAADAIDFYEDLAEDRGIALTSTVGPGLVVRADRQRMRQVLANLIDNALKYTAAGGTVAISAEPRPTGIAIIVADTGAGIAPDDLSRIWERLYRADRSRGEPGLGLGLSLVRAIVAAHGGSAEVRSELGQGSTFTITLPLAVTT